MFQQTMFLKLLQLNGIFIIINHNLVGGHCISVDPYYLAHKAKQNNYSPELILSGRRFNESMGKYVAQQTKNTF